ncbi:NADH-quinone oxidoreductase subunit D [Motilibacter sp. K478]|nr:NADH-quinone oxidoreductase subunit D [Motilibacter aurantiacus]
MTSAAAPGAAVEGGHPSRADLVLPIGQHHPSAHGAFRLRLQVEDEVVVAAEPVVGYMHRGAEKLFEVRDYRQVIVLANRHDWLSAFANELGVVLAVERMLGLDPPERAVWVRTLLAELNRVLAALMFLASPPDPARADAATTTYPDILALRETLQAVLEEVSGGRVHFMFNRVGGLKEDLPDGWTGRARAAVAHVRSQWPAVEAVSVGDERFRDRLRGVGVLTRTDALAYGASGPVAHASGVAADLRRDAPYLAYGELDVPAVTRAEGDSLARFEVLAEQARVALDLADACLDRLAALPPGPVDVRLPKVLTVPEGSAYAVTENPLGLNGYYLVSRGEKVPWRLKLRSASFGNVQALEALLPGCRVQDLVPVLCSLFFVTGDMDR